MKALFALCLSLLLLAGCEAIQEEAPPPVQDAPMVETPAKPQAEKPKEQAKEEVKEEPMEYDEKWDIRLQWKDDETLMVDKGSSLSYVNLFTEDMTQVIPEGANSEGNNRLYRSGDYLISVNQNGAYLICRDGIWQMSSLSIHDKEGKLLRNFEEYSFDDSQPADEIMSQGVLSAGIEHLGDGIFAVPGHEAFFLYDINRDSLTMVHDYRDKVPDHKFKVYYGLRFGGKAGERYVYQVTEMIDAGENSRSRLYSMDKEGNLQALYHEEEFVNFYVADNAVLAYTPDHEEKAVAWYYNIDGREGLFHEEYVGNPVKFYAVEQGWRFITTENGDQSSFRIVDIAADGTVTSHSCGTELPGLQWQIQLCHVTGEAGALSCYFFNNVDKGIYCYDEESNKSTKIDTFPAELVLDIERYFGNKAYAYLKDGSNVCARKYP